MTRHRKSKSLFAVLVLLPWWASVFGATLVLLARKLWLGWVEQSGQLGMFAPIVKQAHWLFYGFAFVLVIGAASSLLRQLMNGRQLEACVESRGVKDLDWRQFEGLLQEVFRRRGFVAVETGPGADGGVDISLRKGRDLFLVQCKHWKAHQVGVKPVRELWGIVAASRARGGIFVTSGSYTREAEAFAKGLRLDLVDGQQLKRLLLDVSRESAKPVRAPTKSESEAYIPPQCPRCGTAMTKRNARKGPHAGRDFWGCKNYPRCRGVVN